MIYEEPGDTPGTKRTISQGGLPTLIGPQPDIARAQDIRTRILVEADDVLTRLRSDEIITDAQKDTAIVSPRQVNADQVRAAEIALNKVRGETDANWWILQANRSAGEILGELMTGTGQP